MNIVKLKSIGFIFACFFITPSYLFSQDIKFKPIPEFDQTELGYGGVTDMTQDADGYMWFSTLNGLYRYDGYQIVTYLNEKGNPNSLAFNHINTVYADENGLIWIGTFGKGMDCLNPKTGNFKHYTFNPKSANGISNDSVSIIRGDTKGGLWIGTHNGLNYFNTQTEEFTQYKHNENDPTSLSYDKIKTIYRDKAGTVWVGAGLPFLDEGGRINKGGLNRFNPQANNFTRYLHNPNDPNSLIDNHVTAIFEDSRGTFWVGTMKDGLHTMDRIKGTFERHPYDKTRPNSLSRPPVKNVIPYADDYISFILEDATKAIWIGTMSNGINRYDPTSKKMTFYDGVKDTTRGLKYCCYFSAFISKDSVLWFAPWLDELVKADPYLKKIPFTSVQDTYLKGAIKENKDILWLYGEKGLTRKDLRTGSQKNYKHDPKKPNSLSHDYIRCIEIDKNNKWWIATSGGGLDCFDPQTETFKHFKHNPQDKNSIESDTLNVVIKDGENLWMGTRGGLDLMNIPSSKFTHYLHDPTDPHNSPNSVINSIYVKNKETVLLGMGDPRGMNVLNTTLGTISRRHYLSGNDISDIFKDHQGIIWVGAGDGIYQYNPKTDVFSRFTDANRLTKFGQVFNIQEDDKKNLWVLGRTAIYKISSNKDTVNTYGSEYGITKNDWLAAYKYIKMPNDEILFIDKNGYFSFKETDVQHNPIPPQIVISDIQIAGDSSNYDRVEQTLSANQKELDLKYFQNSFSISYIPIHYANSEKNTTTFKLDNIDNDWRESSSERKANYFNIPYGTYTFRIRASNYIGVFSERILMITISPPWWQTGWFRLFALCVIGSCTYYFWQRYQKQQLALFKKEQDFHRRIAETEMSALRSQMNPHFIFNVLNSINDYMLNHDSKAASQYLTDFSKLIRLVLENSRSEKVSLANEMAALELYMKFEQLRFEDKLNYTIELDKEIDTQFTKIPPLLIQPYIENAIWHGLMHRPTGGNVSLKIKQLQDNLLHIEVEDDGIGRAAATELKSKSAMRKKSFGMTITSERIQLVNEIFKINTQVSIEDLVNTEGVACGTRVIIEIPC